jgi:cytidyltransferase-like protein
MTKPYGIFIGRFQPFHKGHEAIINEIIDRGYEPVVIIGSAQESGTEKNPYSAEVRRDQVLKVFPNVKAYALEDRVEDEDWVRDILRNISYLPGDNLCKFFYYNKPEDRNSEGVHYIPACFGEENCIELTDKKFNISATQIRHALDHLHDSTIETIYGTTKENKFLKIKEDQGYYYAERLGVDSVAFILYDTARDLYGLINEYKPPIDRFMVTAFGGSLDSDKHMDYIVQQEVLEEAGYKVSLKDIKYRGSCFVSTQMNQFCYLYEVLVDDSMFSGRQPQTKWEEKASVVWLPEEAVLKLEDWKSRVIING